MSNTQFIVYLSLFLLCLLLAAFFSSAETAFIALQRIRLEHLVRNNVKGAKRVARLIERPERLLSTILLGGNFVSVAAASLGTVMAVAYFGERRGLLISMIVVTTILLIFGETTPKTMATRHAERLSIRFARSIEILSWLFTPFVYVLSWFVATLTRMVGGKPVPKSLASPEEIQTMISLGHKDGMVEESEAKMLHGVFDFGDRPVREVMVQRPDVVSIEKGSTVGDFLKVYVKSPLSRFPVYEGGMDKIIGILSVKDVLMALAKGSMTHNDNIDSMIRPAYFTPESKRVSEVFAEMRDRNLHMCVVVDEYGGTAGICSLDGLIEEIVGPMGDELAGTTKEYEEIDEFTWQIDGSMRIEEANEEMGLKLPEGDYETVAGFVLHLLGRIPRPNEQIRYKNSKIVITEMKSFKIEKILITREKPLEPPEESAKEKNKEASYEV